MLVELKNGNDWRRLVDTDSDDDMRNDSRTPNRRERPKHRLPSMTN